MNSPILIDEINAHTSKEFVDLINILKPAGKKIIDKSTIFTVPAYVDKVVISGCGAGSAAGYAGQYMLQVEYDAIPESELTITVGMGNTVIQGLPSGTITLAAGGYRGKSVVTNILGYRTGYDGTKGSNGESPNYNNAWSGSGGSYGLGGAFGYGGGGGGGQPYTSKSSGGVPYGGSGGAGGKNPDIPTASSSRKYSGETGGNGTMSSGGRGGNAGGYGAGGGRGGNAWYLENKDYDGNVTSTVYGTTGASGSPTQGVVVIEWGNA